MGDLGLKLVTNEIPKTPTSSYQLYLEEINQAINVYRWGSLPAPRIELAMLAIESTKPPPEVRFAASSSKSKVWSPIATVLPFVSIPRRGSKGSSRLLRDAAESKRPTSRGIRWSSWSSVSCVTVEILELSSCREDSWSRSSESRSNSRGVMKI